jgi:hypothetical protein
MSNRRGGGAAARLGGAGGALPRRRDLLGEQSGQVAAADAARILHGPKDRALLAGRTAAWGGLPQSGSGGHTGGWCGW